MSEKQKEKKKQLIRLQKEEERAAVNATGVAEGHSSKKNNKKVRLENKKMNKLLQQKIILFLFEDCDKANSKRKWGD